MSHGTLRLLLTRRLGEEGLPAGSPIAVAELYRRLVPYAVCREALGLATKAEYDLALLRLLADESLEVQERALREAVQRELTSPEPGLAILQRFAASEVRLAEPDASPSPVPRGRAGPESAGPPPFSYETERLEQDRIPGLDDLEYVPEPPTTDVPPTRDEPLRPDSTGASAACSVCTSPLPLREGLRYCPSCGADQHRWPCESCGAEVERGWKFCAMCGTDQPG